MTTYLLDTSAIIAFSEDEAGADQVEQILRRAQSKKDEAFVSFMSFMEVFYGSWRAYGKEVAYRKLVELKTLPIKKVDLSDSLLIAAGEIKATCQLSVADSWIAASALEKKAILVHKDPEFEQLQSKLTLKTLPYK